MKCSNCKSKIHLHESLFDKSAQEQLVHQLQANPRADTYATTDQTQNPLDSFVVLDKDDSFKFEQENSRKKLKTLFEITSKAGQIEYPICQECVVQIQKQLDERCEQLERDVAAYSATLQEWSMLSNNARFQKSLKEIAPMSSNIDIKDLIVARDYQRHLDSLDSQYQTQATELDSLKEQLQIADVEIATLEAELNDLSSIQSQFWEECNEVELQMDSFKQHAASLELRKEYAQLELDRLLKIHVLHDAFRIWHSGQYGTINGLRLGRLSAHNSSLALTDEPGSAEVDAVSWAEINAALGQTVLLLDVLAEKLSVRFAEFRLVPLGSFSQIQQQKKDKGDATGDFSQGKTTTFDLFYHNDLKDVFSWSHSLFKGLNGLLKCLDELREKAESLDSKFKLPYSINLKDSCVGGASVVLKALPRGGEEWTLAMKNFLVDCKWLIAFVSK